jgi:hypothetical protein
VTANAFESRQGKWPDNVFKGTNPDNGMQRSADTKAVIFGGGAALPLMPGVRLLRYV